MREQPFDKLDAMSQPEGAIAWSMRSVINTLLRSASATCVPLLPSKEPRGKTVP